MKITIRAISFLIVAVLCLGMVACGEDPVKTSNSNTGVSTGAATETDTVTTEEDRSAILELDENINFADGDKPYEFRILGITNSGYDTDDFFAEKIIEEPINDAIYTRNQILLEKHGVKITIKNDSTANTFQAAKNNIGANLDSYDMYMPLINDGVPLAKQGYIYNLYEVPNLYMEKAWWDQNLAESLTIYDKLYFSIGDITTLDDDLCYVTVFNKDFLAELKPEENPYELVRQHKWTLDKFRELVKGFNNDDDGNGAMTNTDTWGFSTFTNSATVFYQAAGERMVRPDGKGGFEFSMQTERAYEVLETVLDFMVTDSKDFWRTDKIAGNSIDAFKSGKLALRTVCFDTVLGLRGMEMDFGVLPYPLFDEDQEEYQTPTSTECYCPGVMIPTTASNLERTGAITELLAYYGYTYLTPAYYDVSVKGVLSRDEDTWEMLDLIFGNKIYDIGYIYNFGNIQMVINELTKTDNLNYVSKLDSMKDAVASDIQEVLDAFEFNQN